MTDAYWKKRAEQMPHYEPAHKVQNKNLEDLLGNIPGATSHPPTVNKNSDGWKDVDVNAIMMKKMMAGQVPQQHQQQQSSQQQVVFIREGTQAYRQLEAQAYGHTMPIARFVGPAQGVSGKEFEFKGVVNAYIVDGNVTSIDMGNIDHSKVKRLAVVQAPFIGKLLIPETAVFNPTSGPQKQILKG